MTRRPLKLINPTVFVAPKNLSVDEVLIAEVIRETKNHCVNKPMTPVLYRRDKMSSDFVITGNVAAYLVACQLSLDEVPSMEEVDA